MGQLGQALTGKRKSTPKRVQVLGDGSIKLLCRDMGNVRPMPFIWGDTVTLASGTTSAVLYSGVELHGKDLSSYGCFSVTPAGHVGTYYINKDTSANIVSFVCSSAPTSDTELDVQVILGEDPDIASLTYRGTNEVTQSLP